MYTEAGLSHWGQLALLTTQITMPQLKTQARQKHAEQLLIAARHHSSHHLLLGLPVGALIAAALTAAPMPAAAVGFSGDYDPSNWITTLSPASDGSVDTSNAPTDITITGPNNLQALSYVNYTIGAPSSGTVSFDWLYNTIDSPGVDSFGYLINGVQTQLTDDQTTLPSGISSFSVVSGDIFGFYVASTDGDFSAGIATVYNFNGPRSQSNAGSTDVPAPAAVLGVLAAFGWSRKLRRRSLLVSEKRRKSQASVDLA
jgi:hypothetical protein